MFIGLTPLQIAIRDQGEPHRGNARPGLDEAGKAIDTTEGEYLHSGNSGRRRSSGMRNDAQELDKSPAATDERRGSTDERRGSSNGGRRAAGSIHPPYPWTARGSASPTESVFYFLPPLTAQHATSLPLCIGTPQHATLYASTLAHRYTLYATTLAHKCATPRSTPLPLCIGVHRPTRHALRHYPCANTGTSCAHYP